MSALKPCHKCQGKPVILYVPGSSYTACLMKNKACPCVERSPDMELELLVERVNAKNNSFENHFRNATEMVEQPR